MRRLSQLGLTCLLWLTILVRSTDRRCLEPVFTTPMTRSESRLIVDLACIAIATNVSAFKAGAMSFEEFGARNRDAHDSIRRAGGQHTFARRWRSNHALPTAR